MKKLQCVFLVLLTMTVSVNPASDEGILFTFAPFALADADAVTCSSRLTGKTLSSKANQVSGYYTLERYNQAGAGILLPHPVTWSGGALSEIGIEKGENGIYYQYKASDKSETEK